MRINLNQSLSPPPSVSLSVLSLSFLSHFGLLLFVSGLNSILLCSPDSRVLTLQLKMACLPRTEIADTHHAQHTAALVTVTCDQQTSDNT